MTKTYEQLMTQIQALTQEAAKLKRKEVEGVIARIKEAIRVYGLSPADLGLERGAKPAAPPSAKRGRTAAKKGKAAQAIRFRDDNGNTWVGRGPRPQWLRDALDAGKELKDFAV